MAQMTNILKFLMIELSNAVKFFRQTADLYLMHEENQCLITKNKKQVIIIRSIHAVTIPVARVPHT